jgi:hypothetical protein
MIEAILSSETSVLRSHTALRPRKLHSEDGSLFYQCTLDFSTRACPSLSNDSLKECDNGHFVIQALRWTISIICDKSDRNDISELCYSPVFRWLVIVILITYYYCTVLVTFGILHFNSRPVRSTQYELRNIAKSSHNLFFLISWWLCPSVWNWQPLATQAWENENRPSLLMRPLHDCCLCPCLVCRHRLRLASPESAMHCIVLPEVFAVEGAFR